MFLLKQLNIRVHNSENDWYDLLLKPPTASIISSVILIPGSVITGSHPKNVVTIICREIICHLLIVALHYPKCLSQLIINM